MRHVPLGMSALLLVLPLAAAGGEDDPEIRDDPGDVRWSPLPLSPMEPPMQHAAALDIIASWFHDETTARISVTMQVQDLSAVDDFDRPGIAFARWGTRFELSNYEPTSDEYWEQTWILGVDFNNGPSGWRGSLDPPSRNGTTVPSIPTNFTVDREASRLTVTVDRALLGSPTAGDRMSETLSLHDGQIGELDYHDQAPDGTYPSRDYVFQMDTDGVQKAPTDPTNEDPQERQTPWSPAVSLLALALAARRR